jgi:molybdate transport system permease protein
VVLLLLAGTPLAWWLARTRSPGQALVAALVTMPLVLPPTVLGFYLLLLMGPSGRSGNSRRRWGLGGCRSPSPVWWWPR